MGFQCASTNRKVAMASSWIEDGTFTVCDNVQKSSKISRQGRAGESKTPIKDEA